MNPKHYAGPHGHDYYYDADGVLVGQPGMKDGSFSPDPDSAIPVDYFIEPLTDEEADEVQKALNESRP